MSEIESQLRELEEKLLSPKFRADAEAAAALLADDFCEFGSSGRVYDKAAAIAALRDEAPREIAIGEFRVIRLAEDVALVTYKAIEAACESLRSSLWVRRDALWLLVFHQRTNCSKAQAERSTESRKGDDAGERFRPRPKQKPHSSEQRA